MLRGRLFSRINCYNLHKPYLLALIALIATAGLATAQVSPPTFTKAFGGPSVILNQDTTVTFTIINNDAAFDITGVSFTDSLPAGLTVDDNLTGTCNGTMPTFTTNSITLTNATVPANGQCQFALKVKGVTAGTSTNPAITVNATDQATPVQGTSDAVSIDVVAPPVLGKAFSCSQSDVQCSTITSTQTAIATSGGTTTLTYTITNPAGNTEDLNGVTMTDSFPPGLKIAASPAASTTCDSGATLTATPGTHLVILQDAIVVIGTSCTVTVPVIGSSTPANPICATETNSATVTSSNGGDGAAGHAMVTLVCPPSITKGFNPNPIAVNGNSSLTLTVTNPNSDNFATLTQVSFSDLLPTSVIGQNGTLTNGCPAVSPAHACNVTPTFGSNTITLSNATISPNQFCCMTLTVKGTVAGAQVNTTSTPTSKEGGTGTAATATLNVLAPPNGSKSFSPGSVVVGSSSTLTFTITNVNPAAPPPVTPPLSVTLTDNFPAGLTGTPGSASPSTCGTNNAAITVTASGVSIIGASLPAGGSCVFTVTVTPTTTGAKVNNAMVCDPTAGCTPFQATLQSTPPPPPTVSKAFGVSSLPLGGTTSLTFTVTNPDTIPLTNISFTDTLPTGMTVANPNGVINTSCTGATITATSGTNQVSLSNLTLAASASCSFVLNVSVAQAGNECNNVPGASSDQSGSAPASTQQVCVNVVAPPTVLKTFTPNSIVSGSTSTMSFKLTNPLGNTVPLNGVGFSDTLPAGITISNLTPTTDTCTPDTVIATSTTVMVSGVTLGVNANCTISFTVTGTATGNNCVTPTSTNGGTGVQSCATLTVTPPKPPTITKSFNPNAILVGGNSTLTFSITNPNPSSVSGVNFTDTLPSGIKVATPNGLNGTCFGGTITAVPGSQTVSLSSVTIPANQSCSFSISVTGVTVGTFTNNVTLNSSIGSSTGTAQITVNPPGCQPPTIVKMFSADNVAAGGSVTLTFTINNPNDPDVCSDLTGIGFTDTLPSGFVVTTPPSPTNTCGGTFTATAGANNVKLQNGHLNAGDSCAVSASITAPATVGRVCDTTSLISTNETKKGLPATACISVGPLVLPSDVFLVNYAANLDKGDSVVNFTNSGTTNGNDPFGNICVNIYAFSPDEQMVACCSCLVSPNGLHSVSVNGDLIINTLTPGPTPTSIVIKLLATTPVAGVCDPASPTNQTLIQGTRAWATTLHQAPGLSLAVEDRRFQPGGLSQQELMHLTSFCGFIEQDGSGFGICNSCRTGALGGAKNSQ